MFFSMFVGYIDLSKRRVSAEEVVKCEEKFAKAKCVSSAYDKTGIKLENNCDVDEAAATGAVLLR